MNVVPCSAFGFNLVDWEFRLCMKCWLGLQITKEDSLCPVCDTISDSMGDHHATCRGNGDMICQHDSLCNSLFSATQSAALAPK